MQTGACRHQVFAMKHLPKRDKSAKGIKLQKTPCRPGNEILFRCPKQGTQLHEWPVATWRYLQIQLLFPVGAPVSRQMWNSGCFIFRNLNEHLALLKTWPWPNAPYPRTKVTWTQTEQTLRLTLGHCKNVKHLRFIPQIQYRFQLCWTVNTSLK